MVILDLEVLDTILKKIQEEEIRSSTEILDRVDKSTSSVYPPSPGEVDLLASRSWAGPGGMVELDGKRWKKVISPPPCTPLHSRPFLTAP